MRKQARTLVAPLLVAGVLVLLPALALPTASAATSAPFAWGADLPPWWSSDAPARATAIETSVSAGMRLIAVDAKEEGAFRFEGVRLVVADAHAKGLRVVARFDIFEDALAAAKFPRSAIAGGPWVDPSCADVRNYELSKMKELLSTAAVDEITFDHVRYPEPAEVGSSAALPCGGGTVAGSGGADRVATITSFVREAAAVARATRPGVQVSASIFVQSIDGPYKAIGQDAAALAPHVDILRPMIYPNYLGGQGDPYGTTFQWTQRSVAKFGAAKTQPWIEAFGPYSQRPDIVGQELKALVDAGATGGLAWWFWSAGTDSAFWRTAAAAIPQGPSARGFEATFSGFVGNNYWVQTSVAGTSSIASVCAMVDGGPCRGLPLRWYGYAASFYVPTNAHVVFRATSTSGETATSGAYLWPSAVPVASAPPPPPAATFTPYDGNAYWVQTRVAADRPVSSVCASLNGGACQPLPLRAWGAWAASLYAPAGTKVVFEAKLSDGIVSRSATYTWPIK